MVHMRQPGPPGADAPGGVDALVNAEMGGMGLAAEAVDDEDLDTPRSEGRFRAAPSSR